MIYALYLFLMAVVYNYIDFCYARHRLKFKNKGTKSNHKNPPKFMIYIFILWSLMVLYMSWFSYIIAIIDGYPKSSVMILVGVVLIWGMPVYVRLFDVYKKFVVDFN